MSEREFKQSEVVTLSFDCTDSEGKQQVSTFSQNLFVNIERPSGFFVKQVEYRSTQAGTSEPDVLYVASATGELDTKEHYNAATHTATPVIAPLNPEVYVYRLYSSLINNTICTFQDGTSVSPNTFFPLAQNVNGRYTFRVDDSRETPSTSCRGALTVVLQFVKF